MHEKALLLRREVNGKSNIWSILRELPLLLLLPLRREEKTIVSRYDDSIYPIFHRFFIQKRSIFLHLLKKVSTMCNKGAIDFFVARMMIEDEWFTWAPEWYMSGRNHHPTLKKSIAWLSSLDAQCTILQHKHEMSLFLCL